MKNLFKKICAIVVVLGGMVNTHAQQMPPIPTDPSVRIGKLDNGLTYYIRYNERPEKQAEFYIAQKVGSILEEDNQRGLAHFLEHMCFNGTKHFPGNLLREYLESIGVKFGVNLNAYTAVDETVYNISNVPVIRDGVIDSCLLILHDWADDLTLDPKEIDKERGVIHEEWRTSMGAQMRMFETTFPLIFSGSKYAHRLPIGTMEVIDNFPYQDLRDYYEKWYRPDQQGIIVVGDIDVDQIEEKIKKLFSPIKMPANAAERVYYPVSDNKEPIISIAKDKEQQVTQIYVYHKHEPVPAEMKKTMGYLAYNYTTSMIESMLNTRLSELTQKANPPFIGAGVGDGEFILAKTKHAFTGVAVSKDDGIETALATLMREIERARRFGFTSTEYARAKADYLSALESAYNERSKMKNSQFVQQYVSNFINGEPIPSVEDEYNILSQGIIPAITVEQINATLQGLVSDSNVVVTLFCPDKPEMKLPTEADIKKVLDDVKAEKLEAYVDKVSNEPLMKEIPAGGKVVKTAQGAFGSTVLTLSNGVRVILKPTDFKADEIRMQGFSKGGSSLFDSKDSIQFNVLNQVVALGGLGNFSLTDLQKVLAGKMASISTSVNTLSETVKGGCSPKDLETMLQLTYLTFTAPRMDQPAFESYKSRMKSQLANMEADPSVALSDTISKEIYGNNPYALRIKAHMIDQIDYAKAIELYKNRFKDASDFTFILIGNIDQATALPLIEKYLGGLPSINRKEDFRNVVEIRKGQSRNVFHKELQTEKATVFLFNSGECPYTLKNLIQMSMLSQLLTMKYTETVREEEGGSYGVGVSGNIGKYPKEEATLQVYFDTDPEKRAEMTKLIDKGISEFIANGPDADNLKKVKEYMLKNFESNQKENGYWMNLLYSFYWENLDRAAGYKELVNNITGADLQAFAKAFFSQNNRIEVSMTSGDTN